MEEARKFPVANHAVAFPVPPYGVQMAFMGKLIRAIDERKNALLEAPTGCGKTLALLCGSLAWQTKFKEAQAIDENAEAATLEQLGLTPGEASDPHGALRVGAHAGGAHILLRNSPRL